MGSKQNKKFKSKRFQHGYRNIWTENVNKAYYANVNVKFIVKSIFKIKSGIITIVDVCVKIEENMSAKNIFGIQLHAVGKLVNV